MGKRRHTKNKKRKMIGGEGGKGNYSSWRRVRNLYDNAWRDRDPDETRTVHQDQTHSDTGDTVSKKPYEDTGDTVSKKPDEDTGDTVSKKTDEDTGDTVNRNSDELNWLNPIDIDRLTAGRPGYKTVTETRSDDTLDPVEKPKLTKSLNDRLSSWTLRDLYDINRKKRGGARRKSKSSKKKRKQKRKTQKRKSSNKRKYTKRR